ncbi:SMI1/KNR4 family protein [Micromonospora peucetia]|uniref:Cell wall assembly regulator SMI1 n=1 Tax=Micromonospora peucetia TaxID=47871 RepID=A0A1C6W390_9ACTN|nr:SMI1/KNR4 family protein [Micromonospora peucetia]SCL73055.1 Cell wall assembly regulator SMI1 [Micromonospora peucetia]
MSLGPARVGTVTEAWMRMEDWLRRYAPRSAAVLAPPADPGELAAAQVTLGLIFPDELVESLRRHDGLTAWANVFPEAPLLSVAQIVEHRQMCMDVAENVDGFTPTEPGAEPWWHERWLPVAEDNGNSQVIDLRPGPGHGRLGRAVHDNGGDFSDAWPSLAAYLTATADALTAGGAVGHWHPYLNADDELWWSLADETNLHGEALRPAPPLPAATASGLGTG